MFRKSIDEATVGDNIGVLFRDVEKGQLDRGSVLTAAASFLRSNRQASSSDVRFALIATGDLGSDCAYVARMTDELPGRRVKINEDWLAVIVGLALLALVLVGAIPGSVIP